jgi:hypothetical protein
VPLDSKNDAEENSLVDNGHQKTVSGKKQRGPDDKITKDAGGNAGSKGQNIRAVSGNSVGSHKPGGDGPGTKTFKHESDNSSRNRDT